MYYVVDNNNILILVSILRSAFQSCRDVTRRIPRAPLSAWSWSRAHGSEVEICVCETRD